MTILTDDLNPSLPHGAPACDQFERCSADCLVSADLAADASSSLRSVVALIKDAAIVLSRVGSADRQVKRLMTSAEIFDRVVERDRRFAQELAELDRTRGVRAPAASAVVMPIPNLGADSQSAAARSPLSRFRGGAVRW